MNKYKKIIADRLRHLRVDVLGLNQEQMSKLLNLGRAATVSKFETGSIRPGIRVCSEYIELVKEKGITITFKYLRPDQYE